MATGAPRSRAARHRGARAAPPVPSTSQGRRSAAPARRAPPSRPGTSVLSPTAAPSSPQKVLHAPSALDARPRAGRPTRAATSLCGTVTLPPTARAAERAHQPGDVRRPRSGARTYTAGSPRTRKAAFCMAGRERVRDRVAQEGEDARGAVDHRTVPATRLTTAPISSCSSARCGAIAGEIGAERIAHLGAPRLAPGVRRRAGAPCPRRPARPRGPGDGRDMTRMRSAPRTSSRVSSRARWLLRSRPCSSPTRYAPSDDGRAVPGAGAGRRHGHLVEAARRGRLAQERLGHRAAAGVAGADEEDVGAHAGNIVTARGARRPAGARRAGSRPRAPCGAPDSVQSTSVDGGTLPSTPPSSTSSSPGSTTSSRNSSTSRSGPGAGRAARPVGGGRGERLADGADQPRDALVGGVPHRDAAFAPAQLVGQPTLAAAAAPASAGPGQNASDSARADAVKTRPHASAMRAARDEQQERLAPLPSLEPGERRQRRHRRARSPGRTPSRWDSRAAARPRGASTTVGIAASIVRVGAEREHHPAAPREQLGEREVLGGGDLQVARASRAPAARERRSARPAPRRRWRAPRRRAASLRPARAPARGKPCGVCARQRPIARDGARDARRIVGSRPP